MGKSDRIDAYLVAGGKFHNIDHARLELLKLLAEQPRIKVQVKRYQSKVGVDGIRSFMAVVGPNDIGLFVCTGGFTSEAQREARTQETRRLTLIDLEALVELWIDNYANLEEEDRQRLPLRRVYFLAASE